MEVRLEAAHSPTALQDNEKLFHFHIDPPFVLLLRGTNVEYQIARNLYDDDIHIHQPARSRITQGNGIIDTQLPIDSWRRLLPGSAVHVGHKTGKRRDSI